MCNFLTTCARQHAIARAGIEPGMAEDVFIGCGIPEGAAGNMLAFVFY